MISKLPLEIQVRLLELSTHSNLKHANSHFYILYNDLFYAKIISTFGEPIVPLIVKVLPWLKTYVRLLDVFRAEARKAIASRLHLEDLPCDGDEGLNSVFVKDSWRYVYLILKNKRLFAEYSDYKIDEPTNYVYNHFVEINRTYLLSYTKDFWLSPGSYNLNIGLVVKHGSGLGTTKFEVSFGEGPSASTQVFYPPSNINDILPKNQFCFLRLGEFSIPSSAGKLARVRLVMEEIGLYLKSGFRIFFIDICQPSLLFNDYDLLYYSVMETDYKYFINLPLKNLYKALEVISNGEDPYAVEYDENFRVPNSNIRLVKTFTNISLMQYTPVSRVNRLASLSQLRNHNEHDNNQLMKYAEFYYGDNSKKRHFKFNTVYQRRQFVNRFGDFEEGVCGYDKEGLKWKMPLIGEL